jgi:hypothetical protein
MASARTEGAAPPRRGRRGAPEGRSAWTPVLLLALLAAPAVAGDSFLDRSAPLQDAVPYGMALDPATPVATTVATPAAAATPPAGD